MGYKCGTYMTLFQLGGHIRYTAAYSGVQYGKTKAKEFDLLSAFGFIAELSFCCIVQSKSGQMKRKKFSEAQVIAILKAAEAGRKPDDLAREYGMSVGTFYAWNAKFGAISINDAQRLQALEEQNRQLKRLVGRPGAR